jgi:hypothetical protein
MSATINGDDVNEVINQLAPASCIQVPILDTTDATQKARKSGRCKGLQGESLTASFFRSDEYSSARCMAFTNSATASCHLHDIASRQDTVMEITHVHDLPKEDQYSGARDRADFSAVIFDRSCGFGSARRRIKSFHAAWQSSHACSTSGDHACADSRLTDRFPLRDNVSIRSQDNIRVMHHRRQDFPVESLQFAAVGFVANPPNASGRARNSEHRRTASFHRRSDMRVNQMSENIALEINKQGS